MKKYDNILQTVGNTPVVRINRLAPEGVNLYVKCEAFNPMGSVKDRLALGVIEEAEKSGALKPGQTVVEATSGNTGIGLAMVCAQKGYPLVVTMAENFSVERRKLMRFLGARVVLTPASEAGSGMLTKAQELAKKNGWFLCRQFENEANATMHARTTAPEILAAFENEQLDYWVTGYGTGGTLKGVASVLREKSPNTKIVVCEPDNSPLLGSGNPQAMHEDGSPAEGHASFRPHVMQGWTPNFISKLTHDASNLGLIDAIMPIAGSDAMQLSHDLAEKEGIFTGITGGATFAGALMVARHSTPGSNILCMLPDTGERYMSTPLFADIPAEMSEAEIELSKSTPSCRFDVEPEPESEDETAPAQPLTEEGKNFVEQTVKDKNKPVVMFALEWCEFCWSVRKFFSKLGIEYESVDLDSVTYQQDDMGGKIMTALTARTGCETIPQIFIGGEFLGGCTETLDAFKSGELQKQLKALSVSFDSNLEFDPYELFPGWLQPR